MDPSSPPRAFRARKFALSRSGTSCISQFRKTCGKRNVYEFRPSPTWTCSCEPESQASRRLWGLEFQLNLKELHNFPNSASSLEGKHQETIFHHADSTLGHKVSEDGGCGPSGSPVRRLFGRKSRTPNRNQAPPIIKWSRSGLEN